MTRLCLLAASCLTAIALSAGIHQAAAADDLFSTVPLDSVFKPQDNSNLKPSEKTDKVVRVLNVAQLGEILTDAQFEPEVGESAVSVKVKQGNRTFTTVMGLDENRQQIVIVLRLADLEGKPALTAERLMNMMIVNRDLRPAMFSYNDKAKRLELLMGLDNDAISPRSMREELKRLAGVAESAAPLWDLDAAPQTAPAQPAPSTTGPAQSGIANNAARPAAPAQTQPQTPPTNNLAQQRPATPPATATSNVLGRWSAARSATEAFAIQLNQDGTFALVYVKDGKQSKSTGKYTLTGSQLTLSTSDGGKFGGSVSNVTGRSFEFTPPTGSSGKLTFQKAS